MMSTPTITYNNWQNFLTGTSLQALEAVILQSPLLTNLLNAFRGTITLSSGGTYYDPQSDTIYIGNDYASASTQAGLAKLAVALAHELGHAEVDGGLPVGLLSAPSVAGAVQIGINSEGVAAATEFVVASQLAQAGLSTIPLMTQFPSGVVTAMTADLANAGGAQAFILATSLNGTGYLASASATGAALFANEHPSQAPSLTYDELFGDEWVLQNLFGIQFNEVNWTKMTNASLHIDPAGFTGNDIPTVANAPVTTGLGGFRTVAGETLSFSGATSPTSRGVVTLSTATSATIVGGLGSNDVLVGRPGSDTFEVDVPSTLPAGYSATIVANPQGQGTISIFAQGQIGQVPLKETALDQWTDGTYNYQFIPWSQIPGEDLQGIDPSAFSLFDVDGSSGELKITGGPSDATIDVIGFNLQQAEDVLNNGFLGIVIPHSLFLNVGSNSGVDPPAPNFVAGSEQSYTVSVDAPSDSSQTVALTLSGVPAVDFTADTGGGLVPLGGNGTFTVSIAAGETSTSFALINTGDVGQNATLQLNATWSDQADSDVTISGGTVTENYVEPTDDPFKQPSAGALYDNGPISSGNATYEGYSSKGGQGQAPVSSVASGNNFIQVAGVPNDSIAGGTGNDTIYANFGLGVSDGGTDVITGNGGQDVLWASADKVTPGLNGPAAVQIYANSAVSLETAIENANSLSATGTQGDLIVSQVANATLVGSQGNDLIMDAGNDEIVAGPGNETIVGGPQPMMLRVRFRWGYSPGQMAYTPACPGRRRIPAFRLLLSTVFPIAGRSPTLARR